MLKPYMLVAFSHLLPFFMYVFLGFSLALSGEVGIANILSYIALIHGVALSMLVFIFMAVERGDTDEALKIARILTVIDLVTVAPYLIRLTVVCLLLLAVASYMNPGRVALYMLPESLRAIKGGGDV